MNKRTVKLTDAQLSEHFEAILFGGKEVMNEEFSGSEKEQIRKIVRDFLDMTRSESFEATVKKMVKDYIKTDKELEKHHVEISKNVLIQLYKTLWTKKSFWTSDLKNVSA